MSEFTLKEKPLTFTEQPAPFTGSSLKNLKDLQIGSGATQFKADNQGIYLGAEAFSDAVFSVNMEGDLIANSITINGADVSNAFNASANFLNDVINARLDTSSKKILSDFDFGTTDYAGAVKAGDISWNTTTGAITGGDGVAIYRGGIVGAKDGVSTFTIDASTGDATFAGTLSAPSGTLGAITLGSGGNIKLGKTSYSDTTNAGFWLGDDSGTTKFHVGASSSNLLRYDGTDVEMTGGSIVGSTIQTGTTGRYMKMSTDQFLRWYNGVDNEVRMGVNPSTQRLDIDADGGILLTSDGTGDSIDFLAGTGGISGFSDRDISFNANRNLFLIADEVRVTYNDDGDGSNATWYSNTTNTMTLTPAGRLVTKENIKCGGTFVSSDGSTGLNRTPRGYVSGIRYNGGTLQVRYTELTFKNGIITDYGSESNWFDV